MISYVSEVLGWITLTPCFLAALLLVVGRLVKDRVQLG